ncbi:preprotein translocase subunit SecB [Steroidobacter denitrificans]|uniref:Protein-export protein SecB n=1 Tax=Steroidobacter denitrificans TaxID=465721 RepID=A0A127FF25_STEDE|nr:protein-export chaperone SecB [Steroidobacter denitrificans]AMN48468.1 preprotein translocase subunit SecB [Steroidobacter denitrificans]
MADEAPAANGQAVDPNAPQFAPQAVYVKDVSYEAPGGPRIAPDAANPTINLNLNTSVTDLGGDLKEVVLTVRVEAQAAEKTAWLIELQQAGAFGIRNVPAADAQRLLGIFCPTYLLPYARQVVSDLLSKGGFPPFLLPPVNFEALFNQAAERAQQQQQQPQAPATPVN